MAAIIIRIQTVRNRLFALSCSMPYYDESYFFSSIAAQIRESSEREKKLWHGEALTMTQTYVIIIRLTHDLHVQYLCPVPQTGFAIRIVR